LRSERGEIVEMIRRTENSDYLLPKLMLPKTTEFVLPDSSKWGRSGRSRYACSEKTSNRWARYWGEKNPQRRRERFTVPKSKKNDCALEEVKIQKRGKRLSHH